MKQRSTNDAISIVHMIVALVFLYGHFKEQLLLTFHIPDSIISFKEIC